MLGILVGLGFVVGGLIGMFAWWYEMLFVIKGLLPFLLCIGGVITILAAVSGIRDTKIVKKAKHSK